MFIDSKRKTIVEESVCCDRKNSLLRKECSDLVKEKKLRSENVQASSEGKHCLKEWFFGEVRGKGTVKNSHFQVW